YAAVTTGTDFATYTSGALLEFDPITGAQVGTITLPNDPAYAGYVYPFGFSIAADGTFWIAQLNSHNIIHTDALGGLLASDSTGTVLPVSATPGTDGNVYFAGYETSFYNPGIYKLDPSSGAVSFFVYQPSPEMTTAAATGGIWDGDFYFGAQRFDYSG